MLDIPKGRTEDEVGITRRLGEVLQALPRTGPFVFDNAGSHYKDHNIQSWLKTLLERAGMPWRGTHILRKTLPAGSCPRVGEQGLFVVDDASLAQIREPEAERRLAQLTDVFRSARWAAFGEQPS